MRKFLLPALLLIITPPLAAQGTDLTIEGSGISKVKIDKVVTVKIDATVATAFPFSIKAPAGAGLYFWSYPATVTAIDKGEVLEVTAAPKGELVVTVKMINASLDKDNKFLGFKTTFASASLLIGEVPAPVPPVPPTPPTPPGPTPPTPPTPEPAPIPADGLHVLIVYETAEASKLPLDQWLILFSKPMQDWMDKVCVDWRIYDKDISTAAEAKKWQDAMKLPRTSVPWIVISNPAIGGYSGPLPKNIDATKELINKYSKLKFPK